ncbi:SAM-dependent methyltransferase [Micromonospora sp. DT81.3]|uniref:SAM-dependent methyltransferase n=1 Tax=Micromonospora sp. DT81.3 TaxID=3416523 RepID=UPI003CEC5685
MSVVIPVSAEWLTLREDVDARSRSRALALRAAEMVRAPLTVHDLGSGTGSMMRWLAPLLPGPQTWVLHDWNRALLEQAAAQPARDGEGVLVSVRTNVDGLGRLRASALAGASLVTTSALLDVLAREEIEAMVRACVEAGAPALFGLSVTGGVEFEPADARDHAFQTAFNDHQRRSVHGRRLLGPDAAGVATDLFGTAGWSVRVAETPWVLDSEDRELVEEWMRGWVAAAVEQRPSLRKPAAEYAAMRAARIARGGLRVLVHHQDLLAWPP